jgi:3-phenylpropionate/trans-cinnamate dioxygenase ferredoxin reductase subunit
VVIGAGLAAAHVAQTLREEGFDEPVTIVGDEGDRPYERPGLSKGYLQGNDSADSLYVHGPPGTPTTTSTSATATPPRASTSSPAG